MEYGMDYGVDIDACMSLVSCCFSGSRPANVLETAGGRLQFLPCGKVFGILCLQTVFPLGNIQTKPRAEVNKVVSLSRSVPSSMTMSSSHARLLFSLLKTSFPLLMHKHRSYQE